MRHPRIWIGTAVSLAFLVLLLRRVDGPELLQALGAVHTPWLLVAGAVFALAIAVRGARWHAILARVTPIPLGAAAELVVIGCAANNILPARTGEVVRAALLRRRHGGSLVTALGTIVVERVFDGVILALMLATTLAFLSPPAAGQSSAVLRGLALFAGAGFGGVALGLLLLALRPRLARAVIDALLALPPARIGDRLRALAARFLDGLTLLGGPRMWGTVALMSVATWGLEAIAYWIVGIAFGLPLSPAVYFAVCAAANLTIAAPSTSGGIGPYEFFAKATVVYFGVGEAEGTAYAIALHALVLLPLTLAGVLLLWRRDLGLGALVRPQAAEAAQ